MCVLLALLSVLPVLVLGGTGDVWEYEGEHVQVNIEDTSLRTHGGGLTGGYKPVQFHFHWGSNNSRGSEHVIDGKHYPMEMHIVHYSESFDSINDAIDKPDGLMVLGFFFEIGAYNLHFEEIFEYLDKVAHKDDKINIPPVVMERLVPIDLVHYFRYRGSLTTPPCYESVVWTVFTKPIMISSTQMSKFRLQIKKTTVNDTHDESLVDDFRPVQELNGRNVYSSYRLEVPVPTAPAPTAPRPIVVCGNSHSHDDTNSAKGISSSLFSLVLCTIFALFR